MGDPKRSRKKYSTPPHPWQAERLLAEAKLLKSYGLKSKHELWKHKTQLDRYRERARKIASMRGDQGERLKKELFSKLTTIGILKKPEPTLDDVRTLSVDDFLNRRLQTFVFRNGMAFSQKQARQFIVHGHITVGPNTVSIPSYTVSKGEESQITFNPNGKVQKGHAAVPAVVKHEEKKSGKADASKAAKKLDEVVETEKVLDKIAEVVEETNE
ncbi:MAG: 30S ribosomal protein S4 [archaeon]